MESSAAMADQGNRSAIGPLHLHSRHSEGYPEPAHARAHQTQFFLSSLHCPVAAVDCKGVVVAWNDDLHDLTGHSGSAVYGTEFSSWMMPDDRKGHHEWVAALRRISAALKGQYKHRSEKVALSLRGSHFGCINVHVKLVRQRLASEHVGDDTHILCFVDERECDHTCRWPWNVWQRRAIRYEDADRAARAFRCSHQHQDSTDVTGRISLSMQSNTDASVIPHGVCDGTRVVPHRRDPSLSGELGSFVDTILVPIACVDSNCRVTHWNAKMAELADANASNTVGMNCLDLPSLKEACRDKLRSVLTSSLAGTESIVTVSFHHSNGAIRQATLSSCTLESISGEALGVCLLAQDLSLQMEYKAAARQASQMIENANIMAIGVDWQRNIQFYNKLAASVTGKNASLVIGQSIDNIVHADWRLVLEQGMEGCRRGESHDSVQLQVVAENGQRRTLLASFSPWIGQEGHGAMGALIFAHDITGLHHSLDLSTRSLESANVPIVGVDAHGIINMWNGKMVEISGFKTSKALGKCFAESIVSHEVRDIVRRGIDDALKGRGITNAEINVRTADCDVRCFLTNISTHRNVNGDVIGAMLISQDVTEATKHDRAVIAMAHELRQLLDTTNAPIFGIDCDGDVNEWNNKVAEITGFTKEEAFDCNLIDTFVALHHKAGMQELLNDALLGQPTANFDLQMYTTSNEVRHLLVNATARRDANDRIVGAIVVSQDLTEAMQRDRAVAGMAVELRQLIDTANAPIFGIDIDGKINEWNHRSQALTGYTKEDTFDEKLVSFIAPKTKTNVQEVLDAALQGQETSNYELEFVSKTGEARFMLVNATTRRDPELNIIGVVGVGQDVTEDRRHTAELQRMQYMQASQEAKVETERNMTAYFAHELRNPLGAIDSALNAMPDDVPDSARSLIASMQLCSSFMSSIMNNLLDVRKMEEGKLVLNEVPISLKTLLGFVHRMLSPAVKPGVAFERTCNTDDRDWVLGDEHRLQQVFTNVITNAIKYTHKGSIVVSIGWDDNGFVEFICKDTGPGIPKNEQEKLFQRFVQRGGAPGTGLGLAIAKHLVDLSGGNIRFDSDPTVRPGTACIVRMPLQLCAIQQDILAKDNPTTAAVLEEPLRFLIIDDIVMNRTMLKRRMQKAIAPNCTVCEACTGEDALKICETETFDVIVVDQFMEEAGGVMVGTDVVYAMRRMGVQAIIIGCSGNDLDEEFRAAGADWVWKKPMPTNPSIISMIREALTKREEAAPDGQLRVA